MEWISIKDKLPLEDTEIIVCSCEDQYVRFAYYGYITENRHLDGPAEFYLIGMEGWETPDSIFMNITHWMRMPDGVK